MPNTPRENTAKWDNLAEIHYYSYFITSWISFNSWYNFSIPTKNSDREVINHIKNNRTSVKTGFLGLLKGTNQESKQFQENIAQLHYSLQNHNITDENQRICFDDFVVELDRNSLEISDIYNTIPYYVKITLGHGTITSVHATVKDAADTETLLNYKHDTYDLDHLKSFAKFRRLTEPQQISIIGYLEAANPKKKISLITNDENCILVGQFKLVNNPDLVFKAIIEMLYSLRNVLFHGDLTPSNGANKVYEAAYRILKQLVEGLR